MHIAPLQAVDLPAYKALMLHAYASAPDAFTTTAEERAAAPDTWWLDRIADANGRSLAFGAFDQGALLGTVTVEFSSKPKTRHKALVVGMFVHESARGRGVARGLMAAALQAAAARDGVVVVTLTVTEGNAAAIALYASFGFVAFGTEPWAIATPGGFKGKVHMVRSLVPPAPAADAASALQVDFFTGGDLDELAQVFVELHRHYVGPDAPPADAVRANLRDEVLAPSSTTRVVVARTPSQIAGIATFAILHPAPGARGQLFMKDLYVRDGWRGHRVGEALMGFLARHAVSRRCVRFDWTTEIGNAGAIAFYERLGATRVAEKVYFRLAGPELEAFAARSALPAR